MKSLAKVFLVFGCGAGLLILVAAGGAWWYWHRHGDELVKGIKKAPLEGRQEGRDLDEAAA